MTIDASAFKVHEADNVYRWLKRDQRSQSHHLDLLRCGIFGRGEAAFDYAPGWRRLYAGIAHRDRRE